MKLGLIAGLSAVASAGSASTTRYWDCSGGACGCGWDAKKPTFCHSNAMFAAPAGNKYGAKFYGTAAVSAGLGGSDWGSPACNNCWKVSAQGSTIVVKGTNFCPDSNSVCANGKAHFDIAAPGYDDATTSDHFACRENAETEPNLKY